MKHEIRHIAVNIRHTEVESWNFMPRHAQLLQRFFPHASVDICQSDEDFVHALRNADACMVWRFQQEWFANAPLLKLLSTPAAGKDYFHVTPPAGLVMLNGQFHGQIIAESVCGMLLGMCRGLFPAIAAYADAAWPRRELCHIQRTLRGSRIAILGFGHIGEWIGRMLKPFDVQIHGLRRNLDAQAPSWFKKGDCIFGIHGLDEELKNASHVILALPATDETSNILDGRRIAMLQPGATVINIGRGNAIDETALCDALRNGRLAGAFLDVFSEEPLPRQSSLRQCPNLWRLPHASAISSNYLDLYVEDFLSQTKNIYG